MEKTKSKSKVTIAEELGITTKPKKEQFAKMMHNYTGGIPRFVLIAFNSLVLKARSSDKNIFTTASSLEHCFQNEISDAVYAQMKSSFHFPSDSRLRCIYSFMINLYLSNQSLDGNISLNMANSKMPILDIISSLALYVESVGTNKYKIVFSRYVINALESSSLEHFSLLTGLLKTAKELPSGILSQSNMLLYLVAEKSLFHLKRSKSFSEITGFSRSMLAQETINHPIEIKYIPSFNVATKKGTPTISNNLIHNYNPENWQLFIEYLSKLGNVLGIPYDDNSHGPDAILSMTKKIRKVVAIPYLFMFAFKDLQNNKSFGMCDLVDETKKCLKNPSVNGVKIPMVLFIISTRLTEELKDCFKGDDFLIYNSGSRFSTDKVCVKTKIILLTFFFH